MKFLSAFAYDKNDPDDVRISKLTAIIVSGSCSIAGTMWAVMYYLIFGPGLVVYLPAAFTLIVGTAIFISHKTKNHLWAVYAQIICIIYITAFIQWSIGGISDSGFVMAWAFCGPMTALTFFSLRKALFWLALFIINIAITVIFDDYFSARTVDVSNTIRELFFVMNIGISSIVVFAFARYFVSNTQRERKRADDLLLNILPSSIAGQLKKSTAVIAEKHDDVSVLFADLVGFTAYASASSPEDVVSRLDAIFNSFDQLALKYDLEKIKTIGDAYMVAGGIPKKDPEHKTRIAHMALEMMQAIGKFKRDSDQVFTLRIGIHSGPVVAGVIGKSKFAYDLWGDTVNVASRMESSGESGRIHVSGNFAEGLKDKFEFSEREEVVIKGKGRMRTFFLVGER